MLQQFALIAGFLAAWTPPTYNATVVAAFANKTLTSASHFADDDPYKNGTVPDPGRANDTATVCGVLYEAEAARDRYALVTYPSASAASGAGAHVTHAHPCAACSTLQDLSAYMGTHNLTAPVRKCGLELIKGRVKSCLRGLGFTDDCVNIWYFNIVNSRDHCAVPCVLHGKYPYNNPDGSLNDCIQCDETDSGPLFKQFSGRTRRDSGLTSAIERPPDSIFEVEHYYY